MDIEQKSVLEEWIGLKPESIRNFEMMFEDPTLVHTLNQLIARAEEHQVNTVVPEPAVSVALPKENGELATTEEEGFCKVCETPTEESCARCENPPRKEHDDVDEVYYCSLECENNDRYEHEQYCDKIRLRKMIQFIGEFVQEIWFLIREETNDLPVNRFKREINEDEDSIEPWTLALFSEELKLPLGAGPFYRLWKLVGSRNTPLRHAALCKDQQKNAIIMMNRTLGELLAVTGFDLLVEEVKFLPKDPDHTTDIVNDGVIEQYWADEHRIFRVHCEQTDETWVIDLTGAQFGWYEAVMPWDEYRKQRIGNIRDIHELGWEQSTLRMMFNALPEENPFYHGKSKEMWRLVLHYLSTITWNLNEYFRHWVNEEFRLGLRQFLCSSSFLNGKKKRKFMRQVAREMNIFVIKAAERRWVAVTLEDGKEWIDCLQTDLKKVHDL